MTSETVLAPQLDHPHQIHNRTILKALIPRVYPLPVTHQPPGAIERHNADAAGWVAPQDTQLALTQRRSSKAARYHGRRTIKRLHTIGIKLKNMTKCHWSCLLRCSTRRPGLNKVLLQERHRSPRASTTQSKSPVVVRRKGAKVLDLRAFLMIWAIEPQGTLK